ncbi:hypothetical protein KKH3_19940 [Pectobacterium actinidiae]|nr:hypothetical protein KKH3_19940 [Pectobacterium actinidiae]
MIFKYQISELMGTVLKVSTIERFMTPIYIPKKWYQKIRVLT